MGIGYRLRVIRLVPLGASSYGSGKYGDGTYGQRATDTADLQRYEIVPREVSASESPLLIRRTLDQGMVFECWIIAFATEYEGVERSGVKLDLSGVTTATLRLDKVSASKTDPPLTLSVPMQKIVVAPDTVPRLLRRTFTGGVAMEGTYRATITLRFDTERRLTLPINDSLTVVFAKTHPTGMVMP